MERVTGPQCIQLLSGFRINLGLDTNNILANY